MRSGHVLTREEFKALAHVRRVNLNIKWTLKENRVRKCGDNCGECENVIADYSARDWERR